MFFIINIMDEFLFILQNYTDIEPWSLPSPIGRHGPNTSDEQINQDRKKAKEDELNGIPTNTYIPNIIYFNFKFKNMEYQN
uniref:Uncharacterized protein n=1 Tax=viral metagenome TaxID=1070528 RepID=A0A6C0H6W8_9ZZZZ